MYMPYIHFQYSYEREYCYCILLYINIVYIGVRRETIKVLVTNGTSQYDTLEITAEIIRPKLSLLKENEVKISLSQKMTLFNRLRYSLNINSFIFYFHIDIIFYFLCHYFDIK